LALNKIRAAVSAVVLALFAALFLGGESVSLFLSKILPPFQIVPALMKALTEPDTLFLSGLAVVMILSLIFGRVYCSFLCPLGGMQDIFIALSRAAGWRRRRVYRKPANVLRYAVLAATAVAFTLGSLFLLILLDPYSLAGRMLTDLIAPAVAWLVNMAIQALKPFHIYFFSKETAYVPLTVLAASAGFFVLIMMLSLRYGRLYCNTVCPVGAFLGLLSRAALFQWTIDKTACTACRRCERICKADCIDAAAGAIDQSRCVGCFNCLSACRKGAIHYRPAWGRTEQPAVWSPARRGFLIASLAALASVFAALPAGVRNLFGAVHPARPLPVTPPGSVGTAHFTKACTACHLCVSVCPTQVLTPSVGNRGLPVFMQPVMDYGTGYCDYECNACGRVCPTGAILPLTLQDKKRLQIGLAELNEDECVVYKNKKNCGACGEVCPTGAIVFKEKDHILYPEVEDRHCTGCGACELACPTTPKSIIVKPHALHKEAQPSPPKARPLQPGRSAPPKDQGFPF
jgi:ferredoxin